MDSIWAVAPALGAVWGRRKHINNLIIFLDYSMQYAQGTGGGNGWIGRMRFG